MSLFAFLDFGAAWLSLFLAVLIWFSRRNSPLNRFIAGAWLVYAVPTFAAAFLVLAADEASRWLLFKVSYTGFTWILNVLNPVGFLLYLRFSRRLTAVVALPLVLGSAFITFGIWWSQGPASGFVSTMGTAAVWREMAVPELIDAATNLVSFTVMAAASGIRAFRAPTPRLRSLARRLTAALWGLAALQAALLAVIGPGVPDLTPAIVLVLGLFYSFLLLRHRSFGWEYGNLENFLFETTRDGVFFLGDDGRILSANPATKRISQIEPGTLAGSDWADLFDDPGELRALVAGDGDRIDNLPWKRGGTPLYLSLRWTRDALGHRMGAIAVVRKQAALVETLEGYLLTPRELEIVVPLLQGASNQEIGDALFISVGTVKNHLVSIYKKTGAGNRVELFRILLGYPLGG